MAIKSIAKAKFKEIFFQKKLFNLKTILLLVLVAKQLYIRLKQ